MLLNVDKGWIATWNADPDSLVAGTKMWFPSLRGKEGNTLLLLIRGLQKKHILVTSHGAFTWIPPAFSSWCLCTRRKRNIRFTFSFFFNLRFCGACWCEISSACKKTSPQERCCVYMEKWEFPLPVTHRSEAWEANTERPLLIGITFSAILNLTWLSYGPFMHAYHLFQISLV